MSNQDFTLVNLEELTERFKALDTDILMIQDKDDTKKITLLNLILSIIKDEETPGEAKLYSSKKIDEIIEAFKKSTEETITGMEGDVKNLKENYATKKELKGVEDDLDSRKIEEKDLIPINNVLANKRDNNVPIRADELDTSDDAYKIKLSNLAQEVLDAMVGDTPVSIPTVPAGGWLTRHIANNAIISTKLGPYYRYRGFITTDSVNNIIDDGIYLLGPDVKDLPKYDEKDTNLRILEVTRFGELGVYIKQEIEYFNNLELRPRYVRSGVRTQIHTVDFDEVWDINSGFKVSNYLLSDEYDNRGIIEDGNIFDEEATGSYYVMKGVTGTPNIDRQYTLNISKYGNTLMYVLADTTDDYCLIYASQKFLRSSGMPTVTQWHQINKLNKSRFDGEKLLIYGDGISYGIGSSAIRTKSYASLLSSKYGFVVANHALGDATVGNYDDTVCTNKSILTQISTSSIDDRCKYCIIFAGTNDWYQAKGELGTIDDFNDTTFYGSMNNAIRMLLTYAPAMKILLVTPLFRARQDYGDGKNSDDYPKNYIYLNDYKEAIINIGKKYHLPVLNLYDNSCVNKYNYESYLIDGLYPNDDMHKNIADMIYQNMSLYF